MPKRPTLGLWTPPTVTPTLTPDPPGTQALRWRADNFAAGAWSDMSGNGHDGTSNNSPTLNATIDGANERSRVLYNGSNQNSVSSSFSLPQPLTIGIVFRPVSWVFTSRLLDGGAVVNQCVLSQYNNIKYQMSLFAGDAFTCGNASAGTAGTWHHALLTFNDTSSSLSVDGGPAVVGSPGSGGLTGGICLGSATPGQGFFANIEVAELVYWGRSLSGSERTTWGDYCAGRYGIRRVFSKTIINDGDSITVGYTLASPGTQNWAAQLMTLLGTQYGYPVDYDNSLGVRNFGVVAQPIAGPSPDAGTTMTGRAPTDGVLFLCEDPSFDRKILMPFGGTNDLHYGASDSTVLSRLGAYNLAQRASALGPLTIFAFPILSRNWVSDGNGTASQKEAYREAYNAAIANPSTLAAVHADYYCPWPVNMLTPTAYLDASLFGDGIHPTVLGHANLAAAAYSVVTGNGL